jgi:two-component system, sensor histidine kinase and response regulator
MHYPVKVLLVDDRPDNLISLESLLRKEEESITYLFAKSGEEALKIALKEELALILLDVQMPGMNGYEVAQFLQQNSKTRNIPIIFVTAIDQDPSHIVEGFEAGAVDFLFKPLHPYITKAKVNAFISFYIQRKEIEKINRQLEKANLSSMKLNEELEQRVKDRTKDLTRINNDLDNFIYTASHDLKAPINNIEGLLNTFYDILGKQINNSEELKKIRTMIDQSIDRFKHTIQDLTEVAKAQSETQSDYAEINFAEFIKEIKLSVNGMIEESGVVIHTDFSKAGSIFFSKKNLRSIVFNLMSNAIKYRSPERKPSVFISTSREDGFVVISVKDNGLGIRKEDFDKVFAMFKRLHTHVEGTGIGMAIVKKIVENNGGIIELESEVGKGSEFRVYLKELTKGH